MMDKETEAQLTAIRRQLATLCEEMQFLRKHRNVLSGTPILEFDEVCSLLRQSARSVRRLRETGQLVGFTFGRRRFYAMTEVQSFIARMTSAPKSPKTTNPNQEKDDERESGRVERSPRLLLPDSDR
jgi:hypothetical protein